MTDVADILKKIQSNPKPLLMATARVRFLNFSRYMQPSMEVEPFHKVLYEVLDMFAHGKIKKLMITVPPQHGKLLADSTLIATPNGFVRHGDLKVGDYVYGRNGQPVKVLWVSEKTMSEYDVTFSDGTTSVSNAVANIAMCVLDDQTKPVMVAWRRMPKTEGERNKDRRRDEFVTTCRYGMGVQRVDTLGVIITSAVNY